MTYSIKFDQRQLWVDDTIPLVEDAIYIVSRRLSKYTGLPPVETFNAVFGVMHTWFSKPLTTWASSMYGIIRYQSPTAVGIAITIHELMHRLNVRANLIPEKQYAKDKAMLVGVGLWGGFHPESMAEGGQPDEGLADLLMYYFLGTLKRDKRGQAARAWVETYLPEWVAAAMTREERKV